MKYLILGLLSFAAFSESRWEPLTLFKTAECPDLDLGKKEYFSNLYAELNDKEIDEKDITLVSKHLVRMRLKASPGKNILEVGYGSGDFGSPYCDYKSEFYSGDKTLKVSLVNEFGKPFNRTAKVKLSLGGTDGFTVEQKAKDGKTIFENLHTNHNLGWFINVESSGFDHATQMIQQPIEGKDYQIVLKTTDFKLKPGCENINDMEKKCWTGDLQNLKVVPHKE